MSQPQRPEPAKLVIGVFLKDKSLIALVAKDLSEAFGPMDMISHWFSFDFTTYYEREMGAPLFRRMFVFESLIEQHALPEIKIFTNQLELTYSKNNKRTVNVDPGYMLRERFVLASGKNFSHRIYIGKRIYADLTLIYTKGRFRALPWTYPDYRDEDMLAYLEKIRGKYVADIKNTYR
ncbi:MAG: DUF4416 family protein [Desulfobacterales bacterium]|nr:MAG: DUF4416 family protein [Desulfobacterales bacterium]